MDLLVSTDWLAARLAEPDVAPVDGSWRMPGARGSTRTDFLAGHIPGARFFDIDEIADRSVDLPHMLPKPDDFAAAMGRMGLSERMRIVVYDSCGLFSAARVWWTFKAFGVEEVAILDGGLPKWKAEGRPLETGGSRRAAAVFVARPRPARCADAIATLAAARVGSAQILDARSPARFHGLEPEPRPGLRRGRIPGSLNLPWDTLVDHGRLREPRELEQALRRAGASLDRPTIASCGSGVTAAVVALAFERLGRPAAVYDGSWAEWGARADLPIIGPSEPEG